MQQASKHAMENVRPTLLQVLFSVLAAMFGVQSQRQREFDFSHGRIRDYAFVGAVLTIGFIVLIIFLVKLVLHLSGL